MYIFTYLLVIFLSSHIVDFCNAEDTLEAVFVFFRHGDRSPKESFPNDPYFNISYWPMGFGQLTNNGIARQFELGKWYRNRYSAFLSETYSANEIYVFSTDKDRTLMSAAANLAGLYPPKGDQLWNTNLLWRPIPIHAIPREIDNIIMDRRDCVKYEKAFKKVKKSDYFKELNQNYSSLYSFISNQTGSEITDINDIKRIQSTFFCYETQNKSFIPSWGVDLKSTLVYLSGMDYERRTHTDELKRFMAGPFFYNLINHFEQVLNKTEGATKFYMLSGHNTAISEILNTMGVFDLEPPPFASSLIFELKTKADGTNYINVIYKRDELENLTISGCDFDCDFTKFKEVLKPFTVDLVTWIEECSQK